MKYNLTTELSSTSFGSYPLNKYNPDTATSEFDFKDCLFFEVAQTLDSQGKIPHNVSDIKYVYSRKYRPYEMFEYPYFNLSFHGIVGAGRVHTITIYGNETKAGEITSKFVSTNEISCGNGDIDSISTTSITADYISSDLAIVTNISGNNLHYDDAQFDSISATGTADLIAAAAKWADIAELYYGDDCYEPGTLVKFGGVDELTLASNGIVNGCVSEKPAILMNTSIRKNFNSIPLLLMGKTIVKVNGPIKKFDRIELSDIPGVARKHTDKQILGIALESNEEKETKMVMCIIKLTI